MKPVLPKLQEFGEDRDEQVDRVGGSSVVSQRAKRGRVKKSTVVTTLLVASRLVILEKRRISVRGHKNVILSFFVAILSTQVLAAQQPIRGSCNFLR